MANNNSTIDTNSTNILDTTRGIVYTAIATLKQTMSTTYTPQEGQNNSIVTNTVNMTTPYISNTTISPVINTDTTSFLRTTIVPHNTSSSFGYIIFSCITFVVAAALIAKIITSYRKSRSELIGGSARWRLAASQQSGTGPMRTAASYVPMSNRNRQGEGGLDSSGPGGNNIDWERQFFDDTEPTIPPSRLQLCAR